MIRRPRTSVGVLSRHDDGRQHPCADRAQPLHRHRHLFRDGAAPGQLSARSHAVTFDPFGDFETQGYLRNLANEKDAGILRPIEFLSFVAGIDAALERLTRVELVPYPDVLETHRLLFDFIYPWAGQDRLII